MSIKVLVVDDSAVVRQVLTELLTKAKGIDVIAAAPDPIFAMKKMEKEWPDVIILDIEMPRMDGITFLKKIMAERPTPVVICSTLAEPNSQIMQQAISSGAVEIVTKPKAGLKNFLHEANQQLIDAVKGAAMSNVKRSVSAKPAAEKITIDKFIPELTHLTQSATTDKIIALGASTGGTQAIEAIVTQLDLTCAGMVIVQHMPEKFTQAFAERLNMISKVRVKEAENGDRVHIGQVLVAPGGKHVTISRNGAQFVVNVIDGPLVNRHRPSVDVLFRSVAKFAGQNALGIILTGMGDDGARGMLDMHKHNATTVAQNEESCVVFGMPKEAIKIGAVDHILPLEQIPLVIARYSKE